MYSCTLPLVGALLLLADRTNVIDATRNDRNSAVRSLAVLGSTTTERACLAALIAPQFVVAPAHCVASFTRRPGQQLEFASFGFRLDVKTGGEGEPEAGDADEPSEPPTSGFFNETERIRITATTFHPDFAYVVEPESFLKHDWAVLQLERAPLGGVGKSTGNSSNTTDSDSKKTISKASSVDPLPFLDDMASEIFGIPSFFGAIFVDGESLALTWVEIPLLTNPLEICGLREEEPQDDAVPEIPSDIVCATPVSENSPPLPTTEGNWVGKLLLSEHYMDPGYFFVGFGTSHADLPNTQSFTWAEGTGPEFLGKPLVLDARWVHVPPYAPLIGYEVAALDESMKFMGGIRTTRKSANYCGASLIAPSFVLTAAHCIEDSGAQPWVSIGSLKTSGAELGEQIRVARATKHPGFDKVALANDLAVLELKYPSVAPPVKLFNSHPLPTAGQIFGYGATTSWGVELSDVLRFVDVNVVASNQKCILDLQMNIDDTMFCAGGQKGKDACDGDSGGPLVVLDAYGDTALLGVISYGRGCGMEFLPGVYANVSSGLAFISSIVPEAEWTAVVRNDIVGPDGQDASSSDSQITPGPPVSSPSTDGSIAKERDGDGSASTDPHPDTTGDSHLVDTPNASEYVLPDSLAPAVRDAVVKFLIGNNAQISAALALGLLDSSNQVVFKSSESLAALEAVIAKYNAKPLHQRKVRFTDSKSREC